MWLCLLRNFLFFSEHFWRFHAHLNASERYHAVNIQATPFFGVQMQSTLMSLEESLFVFDSFFVERSFCSFEKFSELSKHIYQAEALKVQLSYLPSNPIFKDDIVNTI